MVDRVTNVEGKKVKNIVEVFKNEEINEMVYEDNENLAEKLRWDLILY